MQVKENQIFNLMDTNGRRNDIVNALQGYISILEEVTIKKKSIWGTVPDSLAQFKFYQKAINLSPDVFKQHEPYDKLMQEIEKYPELKKDIIEKILPIDNINIIYLRQLLKLRIFDKDKESYYSPFNFALYMLLKNERISENIFLEIIQGVSPYIKIENIDKFINNYENGDIVENLKVEVPRELNNKAIIDKTIFWKLYTNKKSQKKIEIYWKYYNLLYTFNEKRDDNSLEALLTFYESEKDVLKKAFGKGKNIFVNKNGLRPTSDDIIENNKEFFNENFNKNLYVEFIKSKQLDSIYEYSDTTKRIFKATGIISFDNGYVELAYKELLKCVLKEDYIRNKIWGNISEELSAYYECYDEYEDGVESYFCKANSVCEIFELYNEDIDTIIDKIKTEFGEKDINEIPKLIADKRRQEFARHIEKVYPKERVKAILKLFKDRTNDNIIKNSVSPDATVPTIYEYIIGIAWYYFTGKKIDLLKSYNLTLSANFEPLIHAGGGQGDIVIYEENRVIMLEATLMNANSQKRGEWEPVLRHSINLKIEEEMNDTSRQVTSFFIADNFDYNTINIWKAVASVPLQSSIHKDKFTNNVVIMPFNNDELIQLMDKSDDYDSIINKVRKLFENDKINFDMSWREKFINEII